VSFDHEKDTDDAVSEQNKDVELIQKSRENKKNVLRNSKASNEYYFYEKMDIFSPIPILRDKEF
jgi:hypothetical protein